MEIKRKVLAYITKGDQANLEILVFEQKENPDAGLQVPGGTIEENELLIDALYREIQEETGIPRQDLELNGKVNKHNYFPANRDVVYERTIFHLSFIGLPQKEWEHRVESNGKDDGMTFCHRWILIKDLPELAANQGQCIDVLAL